MGLGQLAEVLLEQGAERGYRIFTSAEGKIIRVQAYAGQLEIPLDFTAHDARKMAARINAAADALEQCDEEAPVAFNPDAEALLAESIAATDGQTYLPVCPACSGDLSDANLSTPSGEMMADKYYCHPCQRPVDFTRSLGGEIIEPTFPAEQVA